jgi:hypothetical protein
MRRRMFFVLLGLILLVLAIGGWVVDGARWALRGRPHAAARTDRVPQPA